MPARSKADVLFGRIAIRNKIVTENQVKECLQLLQNNGHSLSLGKILVKKGYITASHYQQIAKAVEAQGGDASGSAPAKAKSAGGAPTPGVARRDLSDYVGKPLDAYLEFARMIGASDFHFQVDSPPFVRLHGHLVYLQHPHLEPEYTEPRIMEILRDREKEVLKKHLDVDFCYEAPHGRYRAPVFKQRKGSDAVLRVIPDYIPTLKELHLPDTLRQFTKYRQGIVLITGPAGCGKSATMAALIDIINQERQDHIVTVEEPIEYIIESKTCNVNQRHAHVHTESFSRALKSAMRADPDYIAVGEMRDLDTISTAITAAETGHLVFGTLHTTNAMRSIDRIIDVFSPAEQDQIRAMVSESIRGVISQQLIPRKDGTGREPALEVLFATAAGGNLVREKKTFQLVSVMQTGAKQGMIMMDDSIADLLKRGLITKERAIFHAENPDRFR